MSADQSYRRYASECIRLAARASNAHDRVILDRMAATWIQLADNLGAEREHARDLVANSSPGRRLPE